MPPTFFRIMWRPSNKFYKAAGFTNILLCGFTNSNKSTVTNEDELKSFGIEYEAAWRSLVPEIPFSYQATDCKVTVNDGEPMISAEERLGGIIGFMEAFPDLLITMRDIVEEGRGTVFYWNLKGTYTGPEGTGNRVDIDGCEVWKLNSEIKIIELKGYFDAGEYDRQVNGTQST